jgi:hypothetical protein
MSIERKRSRGSSERNRQGVKNTEKMNSRKLDESTEGPFQHTTEIKNDWNSFSPQKKNDWNGYQSWVFVSRGGSCVLSRKPKKENQILVSLRFSQTLPDLI